jgi:hypothetical protein
MSLHSRNRRVRQRRVYGPNLLKLRNQHRRRRNPK